MKTDNIISQMLNTPGQRLDAALAAGRLQFGPDGLVRFRDGSLAGWFGPLVGWGQVWDGVDIERDGMMGVGEV